MARLRTDAAERTAQNHLLRDRVASELGRDQVTIREAERYARRVKGVVDITRDRVPRDFSEKNLEPAGVILGHVSDFKVVRGVTAQLSLLTNAREFGDVLMDASLTSASELLVVAMFRVPRVWSDEADDEDSDVALDDRGA